MNVFNPGQVSNTNSLHPDLGKFHVSLYFSSYCCFTNPADNKKSIPFSTLSISTSNSSGKDFSFYKIFL